MFGGGSQCLAENAALINELNVYPVPDGDTGVNLDHTLRRAWQEIESSEDDRIGEVAQRFAYGALMGARGNSGTILSQLLAGFADGLGQARILTLPLFRQACDESVARAYAALSQPVEGTMLTVAREAAASLPTDGALDEAFVGLVKAARASLENTPNLLPALREAGVVDAGGMGLLCFLQGMLRHCAAEESLETPAAMGFQRPALDPARSEDFGYDVQFLMLSERMDITAVREEMERIGWSVIVVGDASAIKVHVHVENPALPLDFAVKAGAALTDVVVENMAIQAQDFARREADAVQNDSIAVIAVAEGAGMKAIFRDLNCSAIISGGAGGNPATEDFIKAIEGQAARNIIILPNHKDIALAARQAANIQKGRKVSVLPTRTMQEGISALVAFGDAVDRSANFAECIQAMEEARQNLVAIQITRATRSANVSGLEIRQGDYIAIIDGEIRIASRDIMDALHEALLVTPLYDKDLATLYWGADLDMECVSRLIRELERSFDEIQFEAVYGGQALYPLLASVE